MDDNPSTADPGAGPGNDLGGVPVGRVTPPHPSIVTPGPARTPSWVIPMIVLALVAGLGIGLAVGLLAGKDDGSGAAATTTTAGGVSTTGGPTTTVAWEPADAYGAAVTVTGSALPMLGSTATDAAVGLPVPEISGTDFAGSALTIAANGKAKLIVALAHWCPYCNEEAPILIDWYAAGVPESVEVISLHVYSNPAKANFPPADWVADIDWNLPLIADDAANTLVATLGIPAVPFWLLVAADGTVMERATGQVDAATLDRIVAGLAETAASTTTVP